MISVFFQIYLFWILKYLFGCRLFLIIIILLNNSWGLGRKLRGRLSRAYRALQFSITLSDKAISVFILLLFHPILKKLRKKWGLFIFLHFSRLILWCLCKETIIGNKMPMTSGFSLIDFSGNLKLIITVLFISFHAGGWSL